ncbi:MAG: MFS transporter [Pseudohongiella sp.]|nr:MFS transporter [Pseudohongiella sp.]
MSDPVGKQIYYGWKIVAAILVLLTFSSGLSFYNHSIYLNALAAQPAFDVQTASLAVSIFFLSGGIAGLWVAKWVQEYDPRICISAGAVISFIALSSLAYVETVWQLFVAYSFFGVGFSASSLIPATTLVARWFHKKRAMALSIASTGLSLGGVILTPLCVLLVESLSFKVAAPIMGVMYIVGIIPVAWIWLRASPESMGLEIEGGQLAKTSHSQSDEAASQTELHNNKAIHSASDGISFKQARGGRFFWGIAFGYIFLMMAQVGGIAHQYGLVRELLDEAETALVVAILPVASIIGRLLGGWMVGQMSIRLFAISMMILQSLSLILLSSGFSVFTLCLGLALFGTTVGNLLMLQPLLIAEAFGVREYARIFSVVNLMSSWGTAAGPAVLGFAYAASQNQYNLSYTIAAAAGVLGLLLFLAGGKLKE